MLFVVAILGVCGRFYIRIRIQRAFAIDDGILLFGLCSLICAEALLFVCKDDMYLVEAFLLRPSQATIPNNFLDMSFAYQKFITVALLMLWFTIASVKFSFLFLFRKLIDRVRPLVIYWWVAVAFNTVVVAFGISNYFVPCPYFYSSKSSEPLPLLLSLRLELRI